MIIAPKQHYTDQKQILYQINIMNRFLNLKYQMINILLLKTKMIIKRQIMKIMNHNKYQKIIKELNQILMIKKGTMDLWMQI